MLELRVIMNSAVEEVLSFKCCNLHGQNFEIHLRNLGTDPVTVPSSCELEGDEGRLRIDTLYPAGEYTLAPGEVRACYCSLDEGIYDTYRSIVFTDTQGREHRSPLRPHA